MLRQLVLSNFTIFAATHLQFSPGLNVFLGTNGLGKSHLLRVAYALSAAGREALPRPEANRAYGQRLLRVFQADRLGQLVRHGASGAALQLFFDDHALNCALRFGPASRHRVNMGTLPTRPNPLRPLLLPARELLSLYPLLQRPELAAHFDDCYQQAAEALARPPHRPPPAFLSEALPGELQLHHGGFRWQSPEGPLAISLLAEGQRKIALLGRLWANGSLDPGTVLFWDEPESHLNPQLLRLVARLLLELAGAGVQILLATHSLFLLRELELLAPPQVSYFGLRRSAEGISVESSPAAGALAEVLLLDEELAQAERYLEGDDG